MFFQQVIFWHVTRSLAPDFDGLLEFIKGSFFSTTQFILLVIGFSKNGYQMKYKLFFSVGNWEKGIKNGASRKFLDRSYIATALVYKFNDFSRQGNLGRPISINWRG